MLKAVDVPPPPGETPVGELVHRLVEDGKAYARAEVDVAKAIANEKANAIKLPVILFGAAFLFVQSAITVLAVAVGLWLLPMIGPLLAGLVAFLLFAGAAGGMVWVAVNKIKEAA
jgi:hypothetical protein